MGWLTKPPPSRKQNAGEGLDVRWCGFNGVLAWLARFVSTSPWKCPLKPLVFGGVYLKTKHWKHLLCSVPSINSIIKWFNLSGWNSMNSQPIEPCKIVSTNYYMTNPRDLWGLVRETACKKGWSMINFDSPELWPLLFRLNEFQGGVLRRLRLHPLGLQAFFQNLWCSVCSAAGGI